MADYYFKQDIIKRDLKDYFSSYKTDIYTFGRTVNQTFEAYVFASVIKWYKNKKWKVNIINPDSGVFRLKYSTRGAPQNYSYVICKKNNSTCQIPHQLRVCFASAGNGVMRFLFLTKYEPFTEEAPWPAKSDLLIHRK